MQKEPKGALCDIFQVLTRPYVICGQMECLRDIRTSKRDKVKVATHLSSESEMISHISSSQEGAHKQPVN